MAKATKTTTALTKADEKTSALTTGFELLQKMGDSISDQGTSPLILKLSLQGIT